MKMHLDARLLIQKPYLVRYSALEFTSYSVWAATLFLLPFLPELVAEALAASLIPRG
jgi:hypothetical protein